jgi:hypothetical protein
MSVLNFGKDDQRWEPDHFAVVFKGYDGEKHVIFMISGEALLDHFSAILPRREGMELAFVRNRPEIEEKARELYARNGTKEGRVLLRSSDFQDRETLARR